VWEGVRVNEDRRKARRHTVIKRLGDDLFPVTVCEEINGTGGDDADEGWNEA
jgi:hypothetical protein